MDKKRFIGYSTSHLTDVVKTMPKILNAQLICPDNIYKDHDELTQGMINNALIKLLSGTYGRDLEKLRSSLYSLRTDSKGRIILAKLILSGKATFVLVETLPEHEYDQSRCLHHFNRNQLREHIQRCALGTAYTLHETDPKLVPVQSETQPTGELIEYNGQYVEVSEAQASALQATDEAAVEMISGEAGSGKTLLLMHRLSSLALTLATDTEQTCLIWVIVPHAPLAHHLIQEWARQSAFREIESNAALTNPVRIVTPEKWYRLRDDIPEMVRSCGADDFLAWLPDDDLRNTQRIVPNVNPLQVYQELCIIHGLSQFTNSNENADEELKRLYQKPELTQAFLETAYRERAATTFIDILRGYQEHLKTTGGLDVNLYTPRSPLTPNHYYIVDEAQNLPPYLLLSLPKALVAMNDSQSILLKRRVNELLLPYKHKTAMRHTRLPGAHRCPLQPTNLASRLEDVIDDINPKRKQSSTSSPLRSMNPNDGLVFFLEGELSSQRGLLQRLVKEPETAVVFLSEQTRQCWAAAGIEPLCYFSPKNPVLGLEFKRIIMASPIEHAEPLPRRLLNQINTKTKDPLHANEISALELYLNELKAAVTRSTESLIWVQEPIHATNELMGFLKEGVTISALEVLTFAGDDREERLYEQACRLYNDGQHELAFNIIKHIRQDVADFKRKMNPSPAPMPLPVSVSNQAPSSPIAAASESPISRRTQRAPTHIPLVQSIDTTPLNEREVQYIELIYQRVNHPTLNVFLTALLTKQERAAYMLFHNRRVDGYCLFAALAFAGKLSVFQAILGDKENQETVSAALNAALNTIPDEDYFTRYLLSQSKELSKHRKSLSIKKMEVSRLQLSCLFNNGDFKRQVKTLHYLLNNKVDFFAKDCTNQFQHEDGTWAPSFLHILALIPSSWCMYFKKIDRKTMTTLLKQSLGSPISPHYQNVLLSLIQDEEGSRWVGENINLLAPYMSKHILFERTTGTYSHLYFWVCENPKGIDALEQKWEHFKPYLEAGATPSTLVEKAKYLRKVVKLDQKFRDASPSNTPKAIEPALAEQDNEQTPQIRELHAQAFEAINIGLFSLAADLFKQVIGLLPDKTTPFATETTISAARAYSLSRQHAESIALLEDFLGNVQARFGEESLEAARVYVAIAEAKDRARDQEGTIAILKNRAVPLLTKYLGASHRETLSVKELLADTYGDLGEVQQQKDILMDVLEEMTVTLSPGSFQLILTQKKLAKCLGLLKEFPEQIRLLQQLLGKLKEMYCADILYDLAIAYGNQGNHEMKLEMFERCLTVRKIGFEGTTSVELVPTLRAIAQAHLDLSENGTNAHYQKCIEYLLNAKNILEACSQRESDLEEITEKIADIDKEIQAATMIQSMVAKEAEPVESTRQHEPNTVHVLGEAVESDDAQGDAPDVGTHVAGERPDREGAGSTLRVSTSRKDFTLFSQGSSTTSSVSPSSDHTPAAGSAKK